MNRPALLLAWTLVFTLGLGLLAIPAGMASDEDEEYAKVKAAIMNLADIKDDETKNMAEALAREAPLQDVMRVFKPSRSKGSSSVGPKSWLDGIEYKIIRLATRDPMSKEDFAREAKDLVMMSKVTRAVADLLPHYAPKKPTEKVQWDRATHQMRAAALALGKAVEAGDPSLVKKVAAKLDASCKDCHTEYRD
jgi:hypothetical protein